MRTRGVKPRTTKTQLSYASFSRGLNLDTNDARRWATEACLDGMDLRRFKELYSHAYSSRGLNLNKDEALGWAMQRLHGHGDEL